MSTPYLYRRTSGTYYLRFTLANSLCSHPSKRDIRLSLRTQVQSDARHLCTILRYQFAILVDSLKRDRLPSDNHDLRHTLSLRLKDAINDFYKDRYMSEELTDALPSLPVQVESLTHDQPPLTDDHQPAELTILMEQHRPRSEVIVEEKDGTTTRFNYPDNPDLELKHSIEYRRQLNGGGSPPPSTPKRLVSFVFEKYRENEIQHNANTTGKTKRDYIKLLNVAEEQLGHDRNFYTLTFDDAADLRIKLLNLKDGRAKGENAKTISKQRAKKYLTAFKAVAKYADNQGYNPKDIGIHVKIKCPKSKKSGKGGKKRVVYSNSELQTLLGGYPYTQEAQARATNLFDFHFWLLPLLIYTGARVNELCQLDLGDIRQQDNIWYLNIMEDIDYTEPDAKRVKTEASNREVPIHYKLIEIGFIDYILKRQAQEAKDSKLFQGLYFDINNRWAKKAGDWFNGNGKKKAYKKLFEIENIKAKTIHTFRHTFINKMRNTLAIDKVLMPYIVGHEADGQTAEYGLGEVELHILKNTIDHVDFGLDLSHLNFADFEPYRDARGKLKRKNLLT